MAITWSADAHELHLRNEHVSYVMRVHDDGSLGHLYFGAALDPGRPLAHVEPGGFAGFSHRGRARAPRGPRGLRGLLDPSGRACRPRIPDDRWRRLSDPRTHRRARRRL